MFKLSNVAKRSVEKTTKVAIWGGERGSEMRQRGTILNGVRACTGEGKEGHRKTILVERWVRENGSTQREKKGGTAADVQNLYERSGKRKKVRRTGIWSAFMIGWVRREVSDFPGKNRNTTQRREPLAIKKARAFLEKGERYR